MAAERRDGQPSRGQAGGKEGGPRNLQEIEGSANPICQKASSRRVA